MAALLSSLLATAACRALARRFGIMSRPNPMVAQHVRPVAYLGGVGLAVGLAAGALCLLAAAGATTPAAAVRWEVLAGAVAFLAIGLADDLLAFAPAPKLLLQSLAAVGVAALLPPPASLADRAVAVVLVVALSNAMNLVDVCDGLATSLALVTTIALAALAPATLPLALVLVGAGAGFLVFNAPPASIFLGDAGSLLLGFLLAMQSLDAWRAAPAPRTAVALALAHGVPVFEVFLLVMVRARRGASWWSCSPDHFALRLQARGWSRWRVIGAACGIAAGLGALAVVASRNAPGAAAAMAVALLAATLAWRALTRA